jgi:anthraniloyl-CoA monooxygenase
MRIACVGGGPSGLFLSILMRVRRPSTEVVVFERNDPADTFGFGVVFSDETLSNLTAADPPSIAAVEKRFRHWTDMEIRIGGEPAFVTTGHGFAALSRVELLTLLTERAREVGVDVRPHCEITDVIALRRQFDLVVCADGANSALRRQLADDLRPKVDLQPARYMWTGTTAPFERFTFIFEQCAAGWVQAHVYPYGHGMSTFIVEIGAEVWERSGLVQPELADPAASDPAAIAFCQAIFADHLHRHPLVGNRSRWLQFPRISATGWSSDNVVFLGDAIHTAHFSIGSGTKLALEDAIALADMLCEHDDPRVAVRHYEISRRPVVESTQRAAATSEQWFQETGRHLTLPREQFAFSLMTRSQRVTYENLQLRDRPWMDSLLHWYWSSRPDDERPERPDTPPMFYPFRLRGMELANRIVVSPMAQYSAIDGEPNNWHLVHLGSRAVGGAGLVLTEMTCVSPEGRISLGCTGLWNDEQLEAWEGIVHFVHEHSSARIGIQLGHAGRKGSTSVGWEGGDDVPLAHGGWSTLGPSPIAYSPRHPAPLEMTRKMMDMIRDQFVGATRRAATAGFDLLELHAAHGYLLSSFVSPITNQRTDAYGGSIEGRLKFPVEVASAVREAWPQDRPMSVRISATDWSSGGFDAEQSVVAAHAFKQCGVDIIDVSTGQVDPSGVPAYGRLYQVPFSERIRTEVRIPTMAVGSIASVDDANTVLLAGRADLCLLARPHLIDPYWTLNAAIDQSFGDGVSWPAPYLSARTARRRHQEAVASTVRDPH